MPMYDTAVTPAPDPKPAIDRASTDTGRFSNRRKKRMFPKAITKHPITTGYLAPNLSPKKPKTGYDKMAHSAKDADNHP